MNYCSVDDVITFTNIKPKQFGLESEEELNSKIEQYIAQSTSLMNAYMRKTYSSSIPLALENICLRMTVNMINVAQSRKNSPYLKVNDWTIKTVPSIIFTDDLKADIEPFCKKSVRQNMGMDFFVVTGKPLGKRKW